MTNQQKFEVIKALAYGETPEQAAEAEGIDVDSVKAISGSAEINEEREILRKAGYING